MLENQSWMRVPKQIEGWRELFEKNVYTKSFHLLKNYLLKTGSLSFRNILYGVLCDNS